MNRNDEVWVVFWCGQLAPLRLGTVSHTDQSKYLAHLSRQEHLLPDGRRKRISLRTWQRKWKILREQGVQGLYRRVRSDRGKPQERHADLVYKAVELKKNQPERSDIVINRVLKAKFGRQLPSSTLYRHLRLNGATKLKLGLEKPKIRCRWTRDHSNSLWVGDFEHGPPAIHNQQIVKKTYLSAWIDCHSRYVIEARYYVRENLDILIDSLLRAWGNHGASRQLYVDNAKIYHADGLLLACTQLNIELLHRPPRDPPAGGLIERLFRTVQTQFEAEVRCGPPLTLDNMNRLLAAWLKTGYHQTVHSEVQERPWDRYHHRSKFIRNVDLLEAGKFFYRKEERTVNKDFFDVQIDKLYYAVDPNLKGERVCVELDPFSSAAEVRIYSLADNRFLGVGRRYNREKGGHPGLNAKAAESPGKLVQREFLEVLEQEMAAMHEAEAARGIDFVSAQKKSIWSLNAFAAHLAKLLGRKGNLSAILVEELELLSKIHGRYPQLINAAVVEQACEQAASSSIAEVLCHLQSLLERKS